MDHTILPLPANCYCPATVPSGGAANITVVPPIPLPPIHVFCSVLVPPISALCKGFAVFPSMGALSPAKIMLPI